MALSQYRPGAGIYAQSSIVTIVDSNFTSVYGGAIAAIDSRMTINRTTFNENFGGYAGGAIRAERTLVELTACNFTRNLNYVGGADVLIKQGSLTWINGSSLGTYGDSAYENQGSRGGSILAIDGNATLNNIDFRGQRVGDSGGVIYGEGESILLLTNVNFTDVRAGYAGGAVYLTHSTSLLCEKCVFRKASAGFSGGGIAHQGALFLANVVADNCTAGTFGGFLYARDESVTKIINSQIRNSKVLDYFTFNDDGGGGIYTRSATEMSLENVTIAGCSSSSRGGGMYLMHASNVTLVNTLIEGNNASFSGGIQVVDTSLTLINVTIRNNSADGNEFSSGGGLGIQKYTRFSKHGDITFIGKIEMYGNKATQRGGGIWVSSSANLVFKTADVLIYDNNASIGDAVYYDVKGPQNGTGIRMMIPSQDISLGKRMNIQGLFYIANDTIANLFNLENPFKDHQVQLDSSVAYAVVQLGDYEIIRKGFAPPTMNVTLFNAFHTRPTVLDPTVGYVVGFDLYMNQTSFYRLLSLDSIPLYTNSTFIEDMTRGYFSYTISMSSDCTVFIRLNVVKRQYSEYFIAESYPSVPEPVPIQGLEKVSRSLIDDGFDSTPIEGVVLEFKVNSTDCERAHSTDVFNTPNLEGWAISPASCTMKTCAIWFLSFLAYHLVF